MKEDSRNSKEEHRNLKRISIDVSNPTDYYIEYLPPNLFFMYICKHDKKLTISEAINNLDRATSHIHLRVQGLLETLHIKDSRSFSSINIDGSVEEVVFENLKDFDFLDVNTKFLTLRNFDNRRLFNDPFKIETEHLCIENMDSLTTFVLSDQIKFKNIEFNAHLNVKDLILYDYNDIQNKHLDKIIQSMPNIESVIISNTKIQDLSFLNPLNRLLGLSLSQNSALKDITNFTSENLALIHISGSPINSINNYQHLQSFSNLKTVIFDDYPLSALNLNTYFALKHKDSDWIQKNIESFYSQFNWNNFNTIIYLKTVIRALKSHDDKVFVQLHLGKIIGCLNDSDCTDIILTKACMMLKTAVAHTNDEEFIEQYLAILTTILVKLELVDEELWLSLHEDRLLNTLNDRKRNDFPVLMDELFNEFFTKPFHYFNGLLESLMKVFAAGEFTPKHVKTIIEKLNESVPELQPNHENDINKIKQLILFFTVYEDNQRAQYWTQILEQHSKDEALDLIHLQLLERYLDKGEFNRLSETTDKMVNPKLIQQATKLYYERKVESSPLEVCRELGQIEDRSLRYHLIRILIENQEIYLEKAALNQLVLGVQSSSKLLGDLVSKLNLIPSEHPQFNYIDRILSELRMALTDSST